MILIFLAILLGIISGLIINKTCSDEIIKGEKYFVLFLLFGIIFTIGFYIYGFKVESLASVFISSLFLTLCLNSKI